MSTTIVPSWGVALARLLEKAAATWLQAFVMALLGSGFFESLSMSTLAAAGVATIPAGITILANAAEAAASPSDWPTPAQVLFRLIRTWVAVFLGFLAAGAWVLDLTSLQSLGTAAGLAAGAAFMAALKAELAAHVGNRDTAAILPFRFDADIAHLVTSSRG